MKNLAIVLGLICVLSCGCHINPGIPGSGNQLADLRRVGEFSAVSYGGSGDVEIRQGDECVVEVHCDDNLLAYVDTSIQGSTLDLGTSQSIAPSQGLRFIITCPTLERVELRGSGSTTIGERAVESLGVSLSGSGSIRIDNLEGNELDVHIAGSGGVKGSGAVYRLTAKATGSGSVSLAELQAAEVSASVTGSGGARVYASESFSGSITGSGSIHCLGQPSTRNNSVTGSGGIHYD